VHSKRADGGRSEKVCGYVQGVWVSSIGLVRDERVEGESKDVALMLLSEHETEGKQVGVPPCGTLSMR
jgi:hypothetical protein